MGQDPSYETTPGGTDSVLDEDTGLANEVGWEAVLRVEEDRSRRYGGNPAVVAVEIVALRGASGADVSGIHVARWWPTRSCGAAERATSSPGSPRIASPSSPSKAGR